MRLSLPIANPSGRAGRLIRRTICSVFKSTTFNDDELWQAMYKKRPSRVIASDSAKASVRMEVRKRRSGIEYTCSVSGTPTR